jgi:hypothetical protein
VDQNMADLTIPASCKPRHWDSGTPTGLGSISDTAGRGGRQQEAIELSRAQVSFETPSAHSLFAGISVEDAAGRVGPVAPPVAPRPETQTIRHRPKSLLRSRRHSTHPRPAKIDRAWRRSPRPTSRRSASATGSRCCPFRWRPPRPQTTRSRRTGNWSWSRSRKSSSREKNSNPNVSPVSADAATSSTAHR